jgi:IS30 family transposase
MQATGRIEHQDVIALQLGRHRSTIGRELQRNCGERGYRPKQAQQLSGQRRQEKAKLRLSEEIWYIVNDLLREDWSPEQISGWLSATKNLQVSHERIYQHIAHGQIGVRNAHLVQVSNACSHVPDGPDCSLWGQHAAMLLPQ